MFSEQEDWKFNWDTTVLVVAIWNSLAIPIQVAFEPSWAENPYYVVFDQGCNLMFMIDILIQLNTSFYSVDGDEIRNRKLIAKRYLKGLFFIDLVSSLPIENMPKYGKNLKVVAILKVVRIMRLNKLIGKLSVDEETKAYIKIVKLVFMLFLGMHLLGCLWYKIVMVAQEWVPTPDFIWTTTNYMWRIYDNSETDNVERYAVSLYTAILALGGNEMGPRTDIEIVVITLTLLMLAILNAIIFGEMTVLVQMSSRKSTEFQEQVDVANTAMKTIRLPNEAQAQVRTYLITTQGTHHEQKELREFIDIISPSLKEKVAVSIFEKVVRRNRRIMGFIT